MTDQPCPLEVEDVGGVTVARFTGKRVREEAEGIGEHLLRLADADGCRWMVVNLGPVEYMSSQMVSQLVLLHRKLRGAGGRLALCQLQPPIHEVLRVLALTRLFDIHPSEPEALASFAGQGEG